MATVGDDCYFFCTSTCAKGAACPFRHVEAAKTNKIICQHWQTSGCFRPLCKFRHSDFPIQVNYSDVPCYWESQPVGCSKANCMYKHSKPRPATSASNTASPKASHGSTTPPPSENDTPATAEEKKEQPVNAFVMPTVKPIIIDPESEASNSSPVKHPPTKTAKRDNDVKEMETSTDKTNSGKVVSKDIQAKTVKQKKSGKVAIKKKKGILTQKNSKPNTGVAKGKKVKKETSPGSTKQLPVKRKKVETAKESSRPVVPIKKRVKDRLGMKSAPIPSQKEKSEESSDDSDDSIENLKVLSMEEIFRQKALESMMTKRAAQGKPMLPESYTSQNKSVISSRPSKPPSADRQKRPVPVKRKAPKPPPPEPSESEEEEEEDVMVKEDEVSDKDEEENESSSEDSDESSSDSSESEDGEVRRVVINLDAEKAARDRAKASLMKKKSVNTSSSSIGKVSKRKIINEKSLSLTRDAPRLSVKERLGKPLVTPIVTKENKRLVSSCVERKVVSDESEESKSASDSDVGDEDLHEIEIKSLHEIKQEANRKGLSPVKERLGPSKLMLENEEEEEKSGRQIVLSEGPELAVKKKVKKRPWSSKSKKTLVQETQEDDERTVSAAISAGANATGLLLTTDLEPPESPFEILKRRAFLKKMQQLEGNDLLEAKDKDESETDEIEFQNIDRGEKRKKHKHKHKHKRHKKSKIERQIYMPPPKQSTVMLTKGLPEENKKVPTPLRSSTGLLAKKDDIIPEYEEEDESMKSIVSSHRPRPKAAALWAAGLSIPSKGLGGRPSLRGGIVNEKKDDVIIPKPSKITTSLSSTLTTKDSIVPVVKTFSQIMAEKRQKRQQTQGTVTSVHDVNTRIGSISKSSISSRLSPKTDESKPRAPITPIRFDLDGQSLSRAKSASIAETFNNSIKSTAVTALHHSSKNTNSPIGSSSALSSELPNMSDIRPSYKTARSKKLFKKNKPQSEAPSSAEVSISNTVPSLQMEGPSEDISHHERSAEKLVHHRSAEKLVHHIPSEDKMSSLGDSIAVKSPLEERTHGRASTTTLPQSHNLRHSISLDDEFSFLDDGEIEDMEDMVGKDVEPIDDLLQDIDDLLS